MTTPSDTDNQSRSKWGVVSFQRRRFPRIDVTLPVEYSILEAEKEGTRSVVAQNISMGGLLLILPELQAVPTCLKIRIYIGVRAIDAEVKVAWTELLTGRERNEFRCGVHFMNVAEADLSFIKEFIAEYMERNK